MIYDFRLPNITAEDSAGQLKQMQSYMYQLVEQLNLAMVAVDKQQEAYLEAAKHVPTDAERQEEANNTFASIKSLIIKSADIVKAYEEELESTFNGKYVAQSDFGTYAENTQNQILANSQGISELLTSYKEIVSPAVTSFLQTWAYINAGHLAEDPVLGDIYGIEVGQRTERDGQEVFDRYARFTANGVYFYLSNQDDPIAWMSGQKLYITNAEITSTLRLGGYNIVADASLGVAWKWVG